MSTTTRPHATDHNLYPDDDGNPMAENTLQFKWIVVVKEGLETVFRNDPNVFVAGDLLWYAQEGDPKVRTAPDAMVVFGRPKGYRGSYIQWEEAGIPPQVVFEIRSPGNRSGEMERKRQFYDHHGVEEYYLYDPETGKLEGWLRNGDHLREVAEMQGHVSPLLGVRFEPGVGSDNLKIHAPNGSPFKTYQEIQDEADAATQRAEIEHQRAETATRRAETANQRAKVATQRAQAERQRADTATQRADTATQRADTATQRAERLAARLRELGESVD